MFVIRGNGHEEIKEKVEALIRDAENGDTDSMRCIAYAYATGQYLPKDTFAAEAWYRKAWELGDIDGLKELAKLLNTGNGVARDYEEAFARNMELMFDCDPDGTAAVGEAYRLGRGVEKDEAKASMYLQRAFYSAMDESGIEVG